MAWGKGREPKFSRMESSIEDALSRGPCSATQVAFDNFIAFLRTLDWNKTAVFYEENQRSHSGWQGYRVVHFNKEVDKEHWHDIWGTTTFSIGSWMS